MASDVGNRTGGNVRSPNSMSRGTGLRLGIDLDGVVADFGSGWIRSYNEQFDATLRTDDAVEWNAPIAMTHFRDMDEFWSWFSSAGTEGRSLFADLAPYEGALDSLGRLHRNGHQVVILTTKPDFAVSDTYRWLSHHRIPSREVHLLETKAEVACDLYLDDADHNLTSLVSQRPESTICRYVRPWNSSQLGAVDVHNWAEFESLVDRAE